MTVNGQAYPAVLLDAEGKVLPLAEAIQFTDSTDQPGRGGGGSTPGASIVRGPFSFAFDTASLLDGVAFYTPTAGDLLLMAMCLIDTFWDGTTPLGDVGTDGGVGTGIWSNGGGGSAMDMTQVSGAYAGSGISVSAAADAFYNTLGQALVLTADPLKVWVSSTGGMGVDDPGSTQGAARLWIITATPTPFA